ncbi:FxDxF family PEP-CTERM protein [Rhodoferax sp. TBRC 17660]|uniref:FxDxF family PEP-CTERM protein n=1 Tax=Rhodoferax potami TaxID=3068338 RepID=A0ABU3KQ00_9BURK|nr:FxDxF family PEP-CTERM protein [Rhodoferax sp. TBRC 17660]MDT7519546.1 FxDxF family PEP-CTERM protein [Rhodoferax sp. TBRC 17660]
MKKLAIAAALAVLASTANAGVFTGQSVEFQYFYPNLSTPYGGASNGTFAVGAGVEVANVVDGIGTLDISDDGFTAHFTRDGGFSNGSFNGFRITDISGTIGAFTSFSLVSNTGLGGTPTLSFDADNLYVNWQGQSFNGGDVVFSVNVAPVPEPETYAMMLAGLGLLGAAARHRKQKQAA